MYLGAQGLFVFVLNIYIRDSDPGSSPTFPRRYLLYIFISRTVQHFPPSLTGVELWNKKMFLSRLRLLRRSFDVDEFGFYAMISYAMHSVWATYFTYSRYMIDTQP